MYLDDGFGCGKDFSGTQSLAHDIKSDLLKSGFVPKAEKSLWVPVQVLQFLGCTIDSERFILYVTESRVEKILKTLEYIEETVRKSRRVPARKVASLVGQIISMSVVIGSVSQIMTRYISMDISQVFSWSAYIKLSDESLLQLKFWRENVNNINVKTLSEVEKCSKIIYSDASGSGFGGYEVNTVNGVAHGVWTEEESGKSSTWRELVGVLRVLKSLGTTLSGHRVKWFTDNTGVFKIVDKGSMKLDLQLVAKDIFHTCIKYAISLEMEWIPRTLNDRADYLSRVLEKDDWGISINSLNIIIQRWATLDVDWFSSEHNAKLPVFFSRFWSEGSTGVDAFVHYWGDSRGLFVPPPCLILRVVRKMIYEKAQGVLVIPLWKSAMFWSVISKKDGTFIPQISDYIDLPTAKEWFTPCKSGVGIFGNLDLKFRMLALFMDC
ncbi:uncharacterized protein LOC132556090 [Ylistrum balloti]|uniref:uncharacterized protein LOC132556090 n=1 Tax=Ylistrum balloti TaxID=509963 RepID=UPI002905AE55|nr:uncharacterized protein LOC132556090 [Ylistrum balloti]